MFHLQVLTPEKVFFDDMVTSLIAPGKAGYLGILTDHAPLITTLKPGIFIVTDKNKKRHFYQISGGFLHVNHNEAALLIETIEPTSPVPMGEGF